MPIFELAAIGAAVCWAVSSVITRGPAAHLGAIAFTRVRMLMVFFMLAVWVGISGSWRSISPGQEVDIILSGVIGIFMGDTALFATLNRMGPRRTSILFASNAPMSVLLGWVWLGETLSLREIGGALVVFSGVLLAIAFGKTRSQLHEWESIRGPLWIGVSLGLAAGLAQATGSLIARPVMAAGADPIAVSAMRVGVSVVCFYIAVVLFGRAMKPKAAMTWRMGIITAFSGFLAMAVGMTLILFALTGGEVGIISTLSATAPAMVLPMVWYRTGERPAAGAWAGAALVILGSGLIFSA